MSNCLMAKLLNCQMANKQLNNLAIKQFNH